ncbi:ring finger protein-like [Podarcis raffonei]|uniref:ring finger protein-like n=1 Tax=Podarcis raffonei TaxID=65483 RepID=UPI0023293EBA|nr:ring finger protein-like [Podarcis raffonei]
MTGPAPVFRSAAAVAHEIALILSKWPPLSDPSLSTWEQQYGKRQELVSEEKGKTLKKETNQQPKGARSFRRKIRGWLRLSSRPPGRPLLWSRSRLSPDTETAALRVAKPVRRESVLVLFGRRKRSPLYGQKDAGELRDAQPHPPVGCADPRTGPRGSPGAAWRSSLPSNPEPRRRQTKRSLAWSGRVAGPRPCSPAEISSTSPSGSEGFAAPEEGEGGPRGTGTLCQAQEGALGEDEASVASTTGKGDRVVPEDAATSGDEEDGASRKSPGLLGDALEPERAASASEGEFDCILPAPGGPEDANGAAGTGENEPPSALPSASPDGEEDAECPICTEFYDGDVHRPSRLNCGHELCARCLGAVLEASGAAEIGRARCPLCRQKTPVMEWEIRKLQEEMLLLESPQESAAGRAEFEPLPERRPGAWGRLEHRFQMRFRASRPEHGALPCLRYPLGMVQALERLERRSRWLYRLVLLGLLAAETLSLLVFFLPLLVVFLLFAILERWR